MSTSPFAPVDPRGTVLGDEVYSRIGEAILDGTLEPGEHLRDHELAKLLGVSRTPVREALQRLERAGLVEVAPNRFTRVSIPNEKLLADTHEFVVMLMGNVMVLALRRCSDESLAQGVDMIEAMIEASDADDDLGLLDASARFFEHMTRAAGNIALLTVLREGEIALRRNLAGWRPFSECAETRAAGYTAFRDAVAARDADAAERTLRAMHGLG
jgi:DNA-binding GntR family transcriptional regulator